LQAVGRKLESIPDPTQLQYHLPASLAHPDGLDIKVWCDYDRFLAELVSKFPHEEAGIRAFYGQCWKVGRVEVWRVQGGVEGVRD